VTLTQYNAHYDLEAIALNPVAPYKWTVKINNIRGYNMAICFKCENTDGFVVK
jgi:hypothetical protein